MAVSCCGTVLPSSFDCRPDPHFSTNPPRPGTKNESQSPPFRGGSASSPFFSSGRSLILKFPPNFVRQLSTKARRNCSNIGVAQFVAASWSNNPSSAEPASTTAVNPTTAAPLEDINVFDGAQQVVDGDFGNGSSHVQFKGSAALKASFLRSDGSLSVHAGIHWKLALALLSQTRAFIGYERMVIKSCCAPTP